VMSDPLGMFVPLDSQKGRWCMERLWINL
jgi:hypothetical protein